MSRNRLSVARLDDFMAYCTQLGWDAVGPKSQWEAARLRRGKQIMIIWRRAGNVAGTPLTHLTLDRYGDVMFDQWQRDRDK